MTVSTSSEPGRGKAIPVHVSHFVNVSVHYAVDAGAPGGVEPVGVWIDERGRLPDILFPFLYDSSPTQNIYSKCTPCFATQTQTLMVEQIQSKYFWFNFWLNIFGQ